MLENVDKSNARKGFAETYEHLLTKDGAVPTHQKNLQKLATYFIRICDFCKFWANSRKFILKNKKIFLFAKANLVNFF